jgi:aryl-alcohol dehydrogenase-like predicted oxidoreductase
MEYRTLGTSDLVVSAVGLGTWVLGGDHWGKTEEGESIAAINAALDSGINLIDTAPAYGRGHAEEIVGKAIKGRREGVIVATKCGVHRDGKKFSYSLTPDDIRKELEDSLRRLGLDTIDLYQCHWPDPKTPIEETMREMLKMRDVGKIRHIGVSNFDVPLLERALAVAPVVSLQPHYSLLERKVEQSILPFAREKKIGIISYGTLGSGILTGKYVEPPCFSKGDCRNFFYLFYKEPYWSRTQSLLAEMKGVAGRRGVPLAQVAINWARQQEGVTSVLVGARTAAQAIINAGAGNWELARSELDAITTACNRIFER